MNPNKSKKTGRSLLMNNYARAMLLNIKSDIVKI
jgi:hypothetical protein